LSSDVFAWTFPGGKLKQEVTSITLANNTAKVVDVIVPPGKRWLLLGIKAVNDDNVTRVIDIFLYKEDSKTNKLRHLAGESVSQYDVLQYPNCKTGYSNRLDLPSLIVLDPDNTINVTWAAGGASSGSTDADGLVIEYLEITI